MVECRKLCDAGASVRHAGLSRRQSRAARMLHLMYARAEPTSSEFSSKKILRPASGTASMPSVPSASSSQLRPAACATAASSSRSSGFLRRTALAVAMLGPLLHANACERPGVRRCGSISSEATLSLLCCASFALPAHHPAPASSLRPDAKLIKYLEPASGCTINSRLNIFSSLPRACDGPVEESSRRPLPRPWIDRSQQRHADIMAG